MTSELATSPLKAALDHSGHTYRSILAATDFSPSADAAIEQAVWAAERFGSRLVLAHVLPDFLKAFYAASESARHEAFFGDPDVLQREIRQESDERLRKMVSGLGQSHPGVKYETLVGDPFVKIIQAVQAEEHDLVVVGTRGLSAWKQFLLGSTAKRVIRMSPSSVWVVRAGSKPPMRSILVATDLSAVSHRVFQQACWFARAAGSELHLLHVMEEGVTHPALEMTATRPFRQHLEKEATRRLEELASSAQGLATPIKTHLVWGPPCLEIVQHVQRLRADLLVLGTVGRSGIRGLLLGNTADELLAACNCNLLTVKPTGFVSPIEPPILPLHPAAVESPSGNATTS